MDRGDAVALPPEESKDLLGCAGCDDRYVRVVGRCVAKRFCAKIDDAMQPIATHRREEAAPVLDGAATSDGWTPSAVPREQKLSRGIEVGGESDHIAFNPPLAEVAFASFVDKVCPVGTPTKGVVAQRHL